MCVCICVYSPHGRRRRRNHRNRQTAAPRPPTRSSCGSRALPSMTCNKCRQGATHTQTHTHEAVDDMHQTHIHAHKAVHDMHQMQARSEHASRAGSAQATGTGGRATALSSRCTPQGMMARGDRARGSGGENRLAREEEEEAAAAAAAAEYEVEVRLCMGTTMKLARPLSSHARRHMASSGSRRPVTCAGGGGGSTVGVRPMTSGGSSRNTDATADVEQTAKRWGAAASR
jgi:hypothetical protein